MWNGPTQTDVAATTAAINAACTAQGGHYAQYECASVSWDDASRGVDASGGLSSIGSNITDTYLKAKDGTRLYTVRSNNWNEKLGVVSTSDVAVLTGNHARGGAAPLVPTTLRDVLKHAGAHGGYASLPPTTDLSADALDAKVSIRFQTTFLPIEGPAAGSAPGAGRNSMEFATEAYNYNTRSDADPKNLVLLCTTQGIAVQQDGVGAKPLYHHHVNADGTIIRHWLEAEQSAHAVGGPQKETAAERADALQRGKATASVIGIAGMGERFNALLTVQIPLKQRQQQPSYYGAGAGAGAGAGSGAGAGAYNGAKRGHSARAGAYNGAKRGRSAPKPKLGVANAARVSKGSVVDSWGGLTVHAPERHQSEHVTVTVVIYNTVVGGVPTVADVAAAIDDLERLYAGCSAAGKLAEPTFDFMKHGMAGSGASQQVAQKVALQPYTHTAGVVQNPAVFPTDSAPPNYFLQTPPPQQQQPAGAGDSSEEEGEKKKKKKRKKRKHEGGEAGDGDGDADANADGDGR